MNLLQALWKSDGRKRPAQKDIEALYDVIQSNEKSMGEERTFEALLALARLASLLGFPKGDGPSDGPSARATEQLLDKKGVGDLLNLSPRTVHSLMKRRMLPHFRIGRIVRFRVAEVMRAIEPFRIKSVDAR